MKKTSVKFASGLSCEAELSFQEEAPQAEPATIHTGRGVYSASGTMSVTGHDLDTLIFDVLYPEQEGVNTWQ